MRPLTEDEQTCLAELRGRVQDLDPGRELAVEGEEYEACMILQAGWAARYKLLPDGRRQILNFVLPGDFVGLRSVVFRAADQSVAMLTEGTAYAFAPNTILQIFRRCPELAAVLLAWWPAYQHAIVAEHLVGVGRRSAYERLSHFFLELLCRLQRVGLAGENSFRCPLTQEHLADALGLSIVHVNRTLQRLRRDGLIEMGNGEIVLPDLEKLATRAAFESGYLDNVRLP